MQRVCQRGTLELAGRKPAAAIPLADLVANLAVADLERQDALRRDGVAALLMGDDGRRAAEVAALGHVLAEKHGDGAAVLALHLVALVRAPAATAGRVAQGLGQILLHHGTSQLGLCLLAPGNDGAAVWTSERLCLGIPLQIAAAFGADMPAHHGGGRRLGDRGECRSGRGRGGSGCGHGKKGFRRQQRRDGFRRRSRSCHPRRED
ncbi:hypothetical protein SDC9_177562 [bioreactor metagenome]|uniref:Uncharacterized protein n=1 Tax=bioreactor metagenome TaxID=1076179 RepID=A0A645GTM0_9ZZZZ